MHLKGKWLSLMRFFFVLMINTNNLISLDKEFETIDLNVQPETVRMDMQLY